MVVTVLRIFLTTGTRVEAGQLVGGYGNNLGEREWLGPG